MCITPKDLQASNFFVKLGCTLQADCATIFSGASAMIVKLRVASVSSSSARTASRDTVSRVSQIPRKTGAAEGGTMLNRGAGAVYTRAPPCDNTRSRHHRAALSNRASLRGPKQQLKTPPRLLQACRRSCLTFGPANSFFSSSLLLATHRALRFHALRRCSHR